MHVTFHSVHFICQFSRITGEKIDGDMKVIIDDPDDSIIGVTQPDEMWRFDIFTRPDKTPYRLEVKRGNIVAYGGGPFLALVSRYISIQAQPAFESELFQLLNNLPVSAKSNLIQLKQNFYFADKLKPVIVKDEEQKDSPQVFLDPDRRKRAFEALQFEMQRRELSALAAFSAQQAGHDEKIKKDIKKIVPEKIKLGIATYAYSDEYLEQALLTSLSRAASNSGLYDRSQSDASSQATQPQSQTPILGDEKANGERDLDATPIQTEEHFKALRQPVDETAPTPILGDENEEEVDAEAATPPVDAVDDADHGATVDMDTDEDASNSASDIEIADEKRTAEFGASAIVRKRVLPSAAVAGSANAFRPINPSAAANPNPTPTAPSAAPRNHRM